MLPASDTFDFRPAQLFEDLADHVKADPPASLLDVAHSEWPGLRVDRPHDERGLCPSRGFDLAGALLEFTIGATGDDEEMIEPGEEIVLALVPAVGALVQNLVVVFFGLLDQAFQADVPADFVALLVERQQREETGDTAVAVSKRVDAEKIEHERADGDERQDMVLVDGVAIDKAEFLHGGGRGFGGHTFEPDDGRRARSKLDDFVVHLLELAGIAAAPPDTADADGAAGRG